MSKHQIAKSARQELETLNSQIDWKIIKGLSYRKEARRHKFLLARLSGLARPTQVSWSWKSSFAGIF